jgi:hypothetical protein
MASILSAYLVDDHSVPSVQNIRGSDELGVRETVEQLLVALDNPT